LPFKILKVNILRLIALKYPSGISLTYQNVMLSLSKQDVLIEQANFYDLLIRIYFITLI